MPPFELIAPFKPTGDQPDDISCLVDGVHKGLKNQVLLGATGTGTTDFVLAHLFDQVEHLGARLVADHVADVVGEPAVGVGDVRPPLEDRDLRLLVEPPGAGDPMRNWGQGEEKVQWEVIARNKRSVSLNLRAPEGQELALRLLARAIGPAVSCEWLMGTMPARLTSPTVGFRPTRAVADDGQTMEPSVSVPTPTAAKEAAMAAPVPAAGELLIAVQASGVNRPDVVQRKGFYAPPPGASDLPGLEIAGTVAGGDPSELAAAGCSYVSIGQYLAPSRKHQPVVEYIRPELFDTLRQQALEVGFRHVESGPYVRSSYHAGKFLNE